LAGAVRAGGADRQLPVRVVRADREFGRTRLQYTPTGYGGSPWIAGMGNKTIPDSGGYSRICTTGFHARAIGNYFLTAGHCLFDGVGGSPYRQICTAYMRCTTAGVDVGGYAGYGGDAGVIASWDVIAPYPAMLDWTNPVNAAIAVFGAGTSVYGKYYCRTGIGSAGAGHSATTCGRNAGMAIAHDPTYGSRGMLAQTLRGNVCAFDGDSGGPVWDPYIGWAIGIHNAASAPWGYSNNGCGDQMTLYYTDAKPAATTLGVTIATL
ncbi:MAG: hypothetical protein WBD40_04485, partial [Tepidisphaeraceae bacterium]